MNGQSSATRAFNRRAMLAGGAALALVVLGRSTVSARDSAGFGFQTAADYSASLNGLGVVVMQDGNIAFETYHGQNNERSSSHIHSATKGFWGPVVAAMIEDGFIEGYDQRVSDILTEWKTTNKRNITIRQVMQLASGLENDIADLQGADPGAADLYIHAVHHVHLIQPPGAEFLYGPSNFYVMGAVMDRVLAGDASEYADPLAYLEQRLFEPVGITYQDWLRDDSGNPHIPNGAYVTPRNFVLWGQFLLQKGNWDGKQIVRADLMEELFEPSGPNSGFGLFLWLNQPGGEGATPRMSAPHGSETGFIYHDGYPDIAGALGAGKKRMYIVPSLNTIVVRQTLEERDDFDDHTFLSLLFGGSRDETVTGAILRRETRS